MYCNQGFLQTERKVYVFLPHSIKSLIAKSGYCSF